MDLPFCPKGSCPARHARPGGFAAHFCPGRDGPRRVPFRDTPRLCRVPATESRQGPHQTGQEGRSAPSLPRPSPAPLRQGGRPCPIFGATPGLRSTREEDAGVSPATQTVCPSGWRVRGGVGRSGKSSVWRPSAGVVLPPMPPSPGRGLSSAARRVRVLCRASPHVRRLGCEYCRTTPPPSRRRFAAGMGKLRTGFTLAPPCAFTKGVRGVRSYPTRRVTRVSRADSPARLEA